MTAAAPGVVLHRPDVAELARVLGVITEFLTTRPAARASLARFAHPGCRDPYFWTDELLDYLRNTARDLHHHATTAPASAGNEDTP
jgi:hypothetical protein